MHKMIFPLVLMLSLTCQINTARAQGTQPQTGKFPLKSTGGLELVNTKAEAVTYRGHHAVHLLPLSGHEQADEAMFAILTGPDFKDGTIEVDVAGVPRPGVTPDMRGFIGLSFRVQDHGQRAETFYLRPTNGRADDQLRRNHSTQYVSDPDFPWYRLRKENPGVYESYTDLDAGAWTHLKIVVSGVKAQLYVNHASQPCLIVNDLKLGESHGQIALWSHTATDGYFSGLTVR